MNLIKLILTVTLCMSSVLVNAAPNAVIVDGVIIGVDNVLVNGVPYHGRFHDQNTPDFLVPSDHVDQLTTGLYTAMETHYQGSQYQTGDIVGCQREMCEMATIYEKYFNVEKNKDYYLGIQVEVSENRQIQYEQFDKRTNGYTLANTFVKWEITEEGDDEGDVEIPCTMGESSYGYEYSGTSYQQNSHLSFTQTGVFTIGTGGGNLSGESTLVYYYSNYNGTGSPLWLLLSQVQSSGVITQDANNACTGSIVSLVTATVLKTSDSGLVPEGAILFADMPQSVVYTISGTEKEIVDLVSSIPGTVASGTANKQTIE